MSFLEVDLRTSVPLAGASISTVLFGPQMAETCFWGQKTFSFRKETESSTGWTTRKEPSGDRYGPSDER